jgi:hypothetical protein
MNTKRLLEGVVLLGCVSLLATGMVLAQPGFLDLNWWTVDGGGGTSTGAAYTLKGSIGQPDAGTMAGGRYAVSGGFWAGAEPEAASTPTPSPAPTPTPTVSPFEYQLFLPFTLRN